MKNLSLILILLIPLFLWCCDKEEQTDKSDTTDQIEVDSLVANQYTLKAWDTTLVTCYASGEALIYSWECDHGSINGEGIQIKYAAGECCVGLNTITCIVSNHTGQVVRDIQIEVTSYFGGGK